ncbi:MAG: MmgE/PrpD family protein [Pseudorhodoplanes sp.]
MEKTVTSRVADFFADLTLDQVPAPVMQEAKNLLLDTLGCIIAASLTEIGPVVKAHADVFGRQPEASIPGVANKLSALGAAYANGRFGNFLDLDETYPGGTVGGIHIGMGAVAAALALCEQHKLDGRALLLSIIAGYETGGRVSDIGTQLIVKNDEIVGFPAIWGMALQIVYAAAGAAGSVLKLSSPLLQETYALAGASGPSTVGPLWASMMTLPNTKYTDSGLCTFAGMFAAMGAKLGSTGPSPIFDGNRSIFHMTGMHNVHAERMLDGIGKQWSLENITYKPWPTCRWHHQALTALARLRDAEKLEANEIESVVIETNTGLLSPRFRNQNPPNLVARQFSFPHAAAMLLCRVPTGADWLNEKYANDDAIRSVRSKVTVEGHPRAATCAQYFVRDQTRQMPSGVRVTARGRTYHAESDFAFGDPWDPATRWGFKELSEKFRSVSELPESRATAIIESIRKLETLNDLEPLMAALRTSFTIGAPNVSDDRKVVHLHAKPA